MLGLAGRHRLRAVHRVALPPRARARAATRTEAAGRAVGHRRLRRRVRRRHGRHRAGRAGRGGHPDPDPDGRRRRAHRRGRGARSRSPCCPRCSASPAAVCRPEAGAPRDPEARRPRGRPSSHPLGALRRPPPVPGARRRRRSACWWSRSPAPRPAPRPARRQHRRAVHHPAQGLRPARRGLRPGLQRPAAGRRRRHRRSADRAGRRRRWRNGHPGACRTCVVRHAAARSTRPARPRSSPVIPASGPSDAETEDLVARHPRRRPGAHRGHRRDASRSPGQTALNIDISARRCPTPCCPTCCVVVGLAIAAADGRLPLDRSCRSRRPLGFLLSRRRRRSARSSRCSSGAGSAACSGVGADRARS